MNTTDQIEHLLKQGVLSLTIGLSPNKMIFVQATHGIKTGPNGTHMQIQHQAEDESLVTCLNQINRQVVHANAIKSENLVVLPRNKN
jgi:hypothetical protein